ncbi:B-box zinc finger family protein [Striga asiatica]|uniref:B-box zinc finger family protein n=1 Tax=Striga asiatica TaxID=4170 RepID=A0A5A7PIX6_STRAF|nr:B-box zinc finger family protein [Striga asiatica]
MKIMCDVCEKAPATVICCADEAALCATCDVEVHAANKLASKHQRLLLNCLTNKLPPCDICQERTAFIFCVEDRALFCKDCDGPIHSANSRAAKHQRLLATGIKVALGNNCNSDEVNSSNVNPEPPKSNLQQNFGLKNASHHVSSGIMSPSWAVDDLLQLSDYESSDKKGQLEFNELEWLNEMNLFGEQISGEALAAAEVPQLPFTQANSHNMPSHKPHKLYPAHKKPRLEIREEDDEEFFTVPDLG